MRWLFDRYEALQDLYQRYLEAKNQVELATTHEKSPIDGRIHANIPCLDEYKYALGKLQGFLFAMQWNINDDESKECRIVVRRNSDNRIVKIIQF